MSSTPKSPRWPTHLLWIGVSGVVAALMLFTAPAGKLRAAALAQSQEAPSAPIGDLSTWVSAGDGQAGFGVLDPQIEVAAEVLTLEEIQQRTAAIRSQQAGRIPDRQLPVPVPPGDPARAADDVAPTYAEAPQSGINAPNDMRMFFQHDITATEVSTSQRSTIMEPTAINLNQAVFYTANWFAAKSTDGGNTFSYISPYTFFPSVNGGFCCDQWTAYAPAQDMALWYLQYVKDSTRNTGRLARAIGSAGIAANAWVYWDFTPESVGFAAGVWLDYPSMTVAGNSLYITSNAFTTAANAFVGSTVIRIPLAQLAAGGSISYSYFTTNLGTQRLTEGAATTMYWAGFTTTTQMRIHRWAEGSNTIFWDNVNLNAFNYLSRDGVATSPDGTNWALRADSRPTAAYVANGIIGVMFNAKQGTGRPKPYTVHARFSETTRALVSQADIWNADYAWLYPSGSPNGAGHLAGTLQIGGAPSGTFAYPGTQAWITDDVTGTSNTIGAAHFISASSAGPSNNAWGDYFSIRRHKACTNTWVGASHTLQGGGAGTNTVPKYFWFGRERDCTVTPSAAVQQLWPVTGARTGGTAPLWAYVRNTGTVALPADARVWFLVNGPGFNSWVGSASVAGLAPGAAGWYLYNWAIPSGATTGNYEYRAQVWTNAGAISTLFGPQAFTVTGGLGAAVQQLWPVTGAQQGGTTTLWALVRNTGSVPLPADARVWYLVNGPSFNAWVGSTSVAGLAPGAVAWYSYNWAIPSTQPLGNYEYRAQVWTNIAPISTLFGPQAFSIVAPPNQANVLQLWEVVGIQKGTSAPLWALVRNNGTSALPADARVWFQVFGPSYSSWVGFASVAGLAPGATAWYSYDWTVPAGLPDGNYRYHAQVWTNAGPISNYQGPMAFPVNGYQSQVYMLWPVPGAARNATVPLWAHIYNQSNTPLPAGARVWFYVVGPGYTAWVGSTLVQGLPARTGVWYAFNWTIPANQPLGAYNYFAQVWTGSPISNLTGPQAFSILTFAEAGAVSFATPPDPFLKPEGVSAAGREGR